MVMPSLRDQSYVERVEEVVGDGRQAGKCCLSSASTFRTRLQGSRRGWPMRSHNVGLCDDGR